MPDPDHPPTVSTDDATLAPPEQLNTVESPISPSSPSALSRFEFETGRGNEGTKILMVEWDTSFITQQQQGRGPDQGDGGETAGGEAGKEGGEEVKKEREKEKEKGKGKEAVGDNKTGASVYSDWEVSWEGKTTVLPIRESDPDSNGSTRRVYFLLPPGAPIPTLISITPRGVGESGSGRGNGNGGNVGDTGNGDSNIPGLVLHTKPMPAIFTAELGAGGSEAGRRGVLHTLWAKKRMAELQSEIAAEMRLNGEGVGLEMALQERQWIVDHFGLAPAEGAPPPTRLHIPQSPSPATPRSPVGGRLGEKLRGLKLSTSPADLAGGAASSSQHHAQLQLFTLSPDASDVAVSSFASFAGRTAPVVPAVPLRDPGAVVTASLDALVASGVPPVAAAPAGTGTEGAKEDELFALPMSPRSPEMKKSPFSFL